MKNWISHLQALEKKTNERTHFPTEADLHSFCEFTNTSYAQGAVLAACIMNNGRRRNATVSSIFERLAERIEPKMLNEAFATLVTWGFIEINAEDASEYNPELELNHTVDVALRTGQKLLMVCHKKEIHPQEQELLNMYALAVLFLSRNMACATWQMHCMTFIRKSSHPLARKAKAIKCDDRVKSAAVFACLLFLMDWRNLSVRWLSSLFSSNQLRAKRLHDEWMADNSALIATGLLRFEQGNFGRKILVADFMLPASGELKRGVNGGADPLILPPTLQRTAASSIEERTLLYNHDTKPITDELFELIKPKSFESYRKSMQKQKDIIGVTVLLSGLPGTGKTELARQLARKSGRDLLIFNVAEQRDMYYGESEKKIKQLFEYYKLSAINPSTAPILCFNEADSIFQNRSKSVGNLAQTENAVQTILLNELETFSGILICTTNLPKMFDLAFTRRFLYRIDIGMPDFETRKLLLIQFFPQLEPEKCWQLAQKYCFSAAQLLNFCRKANIAKAIRRKTTALALALEEYLLKELEGSTYRQRAVVGFNLGSPIEEPQIDLGFKKKRAS
jgi:DNA polymerase III delta prime subunit